jgi:hypothetical protein
MGDGTKRIIEQNAREVGNLRAENVALRAKLRRTTQILIDAIGEFGIEDLDKVRRLAKATDGEATDVVAEVAARVIRIMVHRTGEEKREFDALCRAAMKLGEKYAVALAEKNKPFDA